ISYDVTAVKLVYKATYKGQAIDASGLVIIPRNTPAPPSVISAQHGTLFLSAAAPSNFPAPVSFSGLELLGATGYITVIPDYIGFGVSKNLVQPYYDKLHSAAAVTDMLKAVTYYLKKEKIAYSERLFLLGYSEGAYVSLAAQEAIEASPISGLSLKAVAAGAGGYHVGSVMSHIFQSETYQDPSYLAKLLNAYNVTSGLNRPLTDFFKEPYAGRIGSLLDGSNDGSTVNAQLSTNVASLLDAGFVASLHTVSGEIAFKLALDKNSVVNWKPVTALRLYHGTADATVAYETSEAALTDFKANGATQVTLTPIPGGTHVSSIIPVMLNALTWFQSLDK
ncbi:MAG TPA: lipase family protein, partial [Pedobacter sp.]|nr:lipase family protein [Pedobacter sp.]